MTPGLAFLCVAWLQGAHTPPPSAVTLRSPAVVAFSPHGGATHLVIRAIGTARHTIDAQAYSFTSIPIARALVRAQARGVRVRLVLDRESVRHRYAAVRLLARHDVPLWEDDTVRIAHSKVLIIDDREVLTGSFNFTFAAGADNSENVLWIQDAQALASAYRRDFLWRLGLSRPLDFAARHPHMRDP
ncbi:MAG: phospholipase D family nuclease [Acidiferrobacteraceae bacterium]|jgi:phosphatidylserine/phosphatidylglycerophosphate/cardiolipin synthase-like enzyme